MPYSTDAANPTLADKKKDSYRGIFDGSGLYGHCGWFMWKRLYRSEDRTPTAEIQWNLVIMRYAEVQKEKYIECWLEGSRFPDLVRWDIADKELADNGKYLPNFCDAMFSDGEAEHRGYIDDSDAKWCTTAHPEMGFKKEKHSYFPIPFDAKNVNPNVHDWFAK